MKLEFLVSTMNRSNLNFFEDMNINDSAIIINQCRKKINVKSENKNIKIISYEEVGLSKSRNRALENSNGDICILSDDDITYKDNYKEIILNAYEENLDADLIVFQIENSKGELYKNYKQNKMILNKFDIMRVSSMEITFKRESLIKNNIKFDEKFGAGSRYYCGEENILLSDCIKKNLKVVYIPKVIAKLQESDSSWFHGYDEKYFISKGAVFHRMYRKIFPAIIIQFAVRKRKLFKESFNMFKTIKLMFIGSNELNNLNL
ncbi:glycosyltransferase [Clostridium perfringens]|uniref:glycosyltransferase n=1 Tax=Clostridium perfringens TaxID=1502 RepID=UPI0018E495B7|nr:glycosyltransferase [Clostridium perfringens]MBI6077505.1 glycosyltransferase [Clostridium perfringens]